MAEVIIYGDLEPKKIKSVTVSIVSSTIFHKVMGQDAMILVFECWVLSQLSHSLQLGVSRLASVCGLVDLSLVLWHRHCWLGQRDSSSLNKILPKRDPKLAARSKTLKPVPGHRPSLEMAALWMSTAPTDKHGSWGFKGQAVGAHGAEAGQWLPTANLTSLLLTLTSLSPSRSPFSSAHGLPQVIRPQLICPLLAEDSPATHGPQTLTTPPCFSPSWGSSTSELLASHWFLCSRS